MHHSLPFMLLDLPWADTYLPGLTRLDRDHWYSNFGLQHRRADSGRAHQFLPVSTPLESGNHAVALAPTAQGVNARTYFSPPFDQQQVLAIGPHADLRITKNLSSRVLSLALWVCTSNSTGDWAVDVLAEAAGA